MRLLTLTLFVLCYGISISTQQYRSLPATPFVYAAGFCNVDRDITYDYRSAIYDLSIRLYKPLAERSNYNFVYSPISIWIMLAAIAEGAEPLTQQKLFKFLNLPSDPCLRQAFYRLAATRAFPSNDVNIKSTRALLIDEFSIINPNWYNFVAKNGLLDVVSAPIRYNPVATAHEIKRIMNARLPNLDLTGNSVLLDTFDYNGLWTTAFLDAKVERAPFYDPNGKQIGAVDLMRVKRQARMGYLKSANAKVLELAVGADGRYRMLFCQILVNNDVKPIVAAVTREMVFEMFASLRNSDVLLDVAIPRMLITTEINVRAILEDVGLTDLWSDPAVTRHISDPPAFPSSFVQRSTVVLNNTGVLFPVEEQNSANLRSGLEPIIGTEFIADRPFLFGLFDAETYSCLMSAVYTSPTYNKN